MLMGCSIVGLYHVFAASLDLFIGPRAENKVNMSVRDRDHLFFTDKVRNSVFLRWITSVIFSRL
jgi:hypothetical protein